MNHHGMIGSDITTCNQCLTYLQKIAPFAEKECYDCFNADEWGKPQFEITKDSPRPVVNVTYKVGGMEKTPLYDDLLKQIRSTNDRITKYFEDKKSKWS